MTGRGNDHVLILSAASSLAIGVFGVLTRRNAITILVSVEIMMNAANLNLVAFSRLYHPEMMTGQVFAIFGIGIAASRGGGGAGADPDHLPAISGPPTWIASTS